MCYSPLLQARWRARPSWRRKLPRTRETMSGAPPNRLQYRGARERTAAFHEEAEIFRRERDQAWEALTSSQEQTTVLEERVSRGAIEVSSARREAQEARAASESLECELRDARAALRSAELRPTADVGTLAIVKSELEAAMCTATREEAAAKTERQEAKAAAVTADDEIRRMREAAGNECDAVAEQRQEHRRQQQQLLVELAQKTNEVTSQDRSSCGKIEEMEVSLRLARHEAAKAESSFASVCSRSAARQHSLEEAVAAATSGLDSVRSELVATEADAAQKRRIANETVAEERARCLYTEDQMKVALARLASEEEELAVMRRDRDGFEGSLADSERQSAAFQRALKEAKHESNHLGRLHHSELDQLREAARNAAEGERAAIQERRAESNVVWELEARLARETAEVGNAEDAQAEMAHLRRAHAAEEASAVSLVREVERLGERLYRMGQTCEQLRLRAEEVDAGNRQGREAQGTPVPHSSRHGTPPVGQQQGSRSVLPTPRGTRPHPKTMRSPSAVVGGGAAGVEGEPLLNFGGRADAPPLAPHEGGCGATSLPPAQRRPSPRSELPRRTRTLRDSAVGLARSRGRETSSSGVAGRGSGGEARVDSSDVLASGIGGAITS